MIFEEPPSGGFSRAIWLEYANQQTFKGDESGELPSRHTDDIEKTENSQENQGCLVFYIEIPARLW